MSEAIRVIALVLVVVIVLDSLVTHVADPKVS
jgi:hypothetical protein